MNRIAVIGGGAAGMMAAISAAENGAHVTLFEKNEKTGKKLYITGKGRCNLTNACGKEDFFRHIFRNPRFFYSAFSVLDNASLMEIVSGMDVKLKVERGERVFPESDRSSDIIHAFNKSMQSLGVNVRLGCEVAGVLTEDGTVRGLRLANGECPEFDRVILATGGVSYSSTGSTGDGYRFAADSGHGVTAVYPSLVPIETRQTWPYELTGLTLKNVELSAYATGKKKPFFKEQGEMLFTHFGVSGPLVLKLSGLIPEANLEKTDKGFLIRGIGLSIDLKPALDHAQLDTRLVRDTMEKQRSHLSSFMDGLVPHSLGQVILRLAHLPEKRTVDSLTREERSTLCTLLKDLPLEASALRGFDEAIITRGGILIKQINSSTMESKIVKGLYFAGEVMDIDAATGGFNLQIAFSTGYLAGMSAAKE